MEEQDQRLRQSQRAYVGFLDDGEQDGQYESLVKEMIANRGKRLVVNINDLRKALPDRAKALLESAGDEIVALQRALKEYVGSLDPTYAKESKEFYVGFEGSFGARHVTARTLTSRHINNLVMILFDNSIITSNVELKVLEVFTINTLDVKTKVDGREFTTVDSF